MMKTFFAITVVGLMSGLVFFGARQFGETWAYFPYRFQQTAPLNIPEPGGYLEIGIRVDRTTPCPSEFYREIYDGKGVRVEQYHWSQGAKPEGNDEYVIRLKVPTVAEPGDRARYCFAQSPKCNVLQNALPYWTPMKCYGFKIKEPEQ